MLPHSQGVARPSDVCLLLEGTYPYVSGGVSSWVHDIVRSMPELGFALLHIGPTEGAYGEPRYVLPDNVTSLACSSGIGVISSVYRPWGTVIVSAASRAPYRVRFCDVEAVATAVREADADTPSAPWLRRL